MNTYGLKYKLFLFFDIVPAIPDVTNVTLLITDLFAPGLQSGPFGPLFRPPRRRRPRPDPLPIEHPQCFSATVSADRIHPLSTGLPQPELKLLHRYGHPRPQYARQEFRHRGVLRMRGRIQTGQSRLHRYEAAAHRR